MTTLCRHRWEVEVQLLPIRNPTLEGGGWSAPRPDHFTPGKDPLLMVQEARWTLGRSGETEPVLTVSIFFQKIQ
jgi:hypothetical protein